MPPPLPYLSSSTAQRLNGSTAQRLNGSTADNWKGAIASRHRHPHRVELGRSAQTVEMLQVQVDRGQGGTALAFDSTPGSTNTAPHPAALTFWKFRAIWHLDDAQVGIWSPEERIVVGGGS